MLKKIVFISVVVTLLFTGCASKKLLYTWSNYDNTSYKSLKYGDEKSTTNLINSYQQIIKKQEGARKTVPPGIYADYGFLLLQTGENKEGLAMLNKEIALYPESKVFIERILKIFEQ